MSSMAYWVTAQAMPSAPALRGPVQRHVLDQRPVGDDHAGGVGGGVAGHALEALGRVQQRAHVRLVLVLLGQLRCVELVRLVLAARPQRVGDAARLPGTAGTSRATRSTSGSGMSRARPMSRMAARAPSVPKVMIWATRSWPYFCEGVLDQLVAPVVGEVQVDVGHATRATG